MAAGSRLAFVAALAAFPALALLAACNRDAQPEPTLAAPAPVATAPTAPPAVGGVHLAFAADAGSIGSEVGERVPGSGISSQGRAGWLVYGPYAAVPAGRYRAVIHGAILDGHGGHVHADVAHSKGRVLVAALELDPVALAAGASGTELVVMPFELSQPVEDLELRLRVDERGRVTVRSLKIDSLP